MPRGSLYCPKKRPLEANVFRQIKFPERLNFAMVTPCPATQMFSCKSVTKTVLGELAPLTQRNSGGVAEFPLLLTIANTKIYEHKVRIVRQKPPTVLCFASFWRLLRSENLSRLIILLEFRYVACSLQSSSTPELNRNAR